MNWSGSILVDSSIWINYFKLGKHAVLSKLILENLICTNELILTELIPFALHQEKYALADGLLAINKIPLNIDWEGIRKLQQLHLSHGINRVGIPDLIIAQQALEYGLQLWSLDKHFAHMSKIVHLDLFYT